MGSIIGEITGTSGAARDAAAAQGRASAAANATQLQMYNQQRQDAQPWTQVGLSALTQMQDPSFQKSFSFADYQQDPSYQYQLDEATKALQKSAAAKGGLLSGATMRSLASTATNMANQNYQNAFNNYRAETGDQFGRLSTLAGLGQNALNGTMGAAQNYGNNVSQNQIGLGNAQGAATIGANQSGLNTLAQLGGTAAMIFSDERLKKDVEPISKDDLSELRRNLRALKFNYAHEVYGPTEGGFYGVMAQDLEKSKLGRSCVYEDEFGNKKIDPKRAMSLFLASMAEG
jgi:hypothetical protein